jgi:hypothetical protein
MGLRDLNMQPRPAKQNIGFFNGLFESLYIVLMFFICHIIFSNNKLIGNGLHHKTAFLWSTFQQLVSRQRLACIRAVRFGILDVLAVFY